MSPIEIDGAAGEGGGQILRTSLALSICTGRPVAVRDIRARRPRPGLMRQHLTCVQAAQAVCSAKVAGAEPGSQQLLFEPGPVQAGDYAFSVGTAGSCTLVLQTVLPALMLAAAESRVTIRGGTHNPLAPPFHFLARSFAPLLRRLGVGLDLQLRRHGFYPAGGGEMAAQVRPSAGGLTPFDLVERGALVEAFADVLAPGLPRNVAARELDVLAAALGWPAANLRAPALRHDEGPGNALMATLVFEQMSEVVTAFGDKRVSARQVACAVVDGVLAHCASTGALGAHLADQWVMPLALAVTQRGGAATFTCTQATAHLTSNIAVIERFLPVRFQIEADQSGLPARVQVAAISD